MVISMLRLKKLRRPNANFVLFGAQCFFGAHYIEFKASGGRKRIEGTLLKISLRGAQVPARERNAAASF
jgi:hypothetical protein